MGNVAIKAFAGPEPISPVLAEEEDPTELHARDARIDKLATLSLSANNENNDNSPRQEGLHSRFLATIMHSTMPGSDKAYHSTLRSTLMETFKPKAMAGSFQFRRYFQYLIDKLLIAKALEDRLKNTEEGHPLFPFCLTKLYRSEKIAEDLDFIEIQFPGELPLLATDASLAYKKSIEDCPQELLLAYWYTVFLADLNGGQVIKRMFARSLKEDFGMESSAEKGLASFSFKTKNLDKLREKCGKLIDSYDCDEETAKLLLEKVKESFCQTLSLFKDIQKRHDKLEKALHTFDE